MEIISLSNVTVRTPQGEPILDGFELHVEKGRLQILLGPGGSGKSTVFHLLTGEREPESGDVIVAERSVPSLTRRERSKHRRSIGVVFQNMQLLDDRPVAEQIALPLEIEGMSSARRRQRVDEILMRFQLESIRDKYPHSLSMGERQRVMIARAVATEPLVLLADEPAGHLDRAAAAEIAEILRNEHLRGMTILLGTGDEHFASLFPEASIVSLAKETEMVAKQVNYY